MRIFYLNFKIPTLAYTEVKKQWDLSIIQIHCKTATNYDIVYQHYLIRKNGQIHREVVSQSHGSVVVIQIARLPKDFYPFGSVYLIGMEEWKTNNKTIVANVLIF